MKHHRAARLALLLLLTLSAGLPLGGGLSAPAQAQQAQQQARLSPGQAAALVQKHYGGKVLKVDALERGDRVIYRVKILQSEGRIRVISVDARSGRILKR